MTKSQAIRDYKTANPDATNATIAEATKTNPLYVYQTLRKSMKINKVKNLPKSKDDLIGEYSARINNLRFELAEEKRIYIQREIKLMGVIDYLESKINGSSV